MRSAATLYLVPNTLDLGTQPAPSIEWAIPAKVLIQAAQLKHWIAENAKTTRAFLKRIDAIAPLHLPLQSLDIVEIPRHPKGGSTEIGACVQSLLAPALEGNDIGLVSEAGLPGVADPGAHVVATAHQMGIPVVSLAGPSSIVMALAASGLHGQSFAFVGYLPVEAGARGQRLRELEAISRRDQQTQLMIETPYRNQVFFEALLTHLTDTCMVSVSCGLTLPGGFSQTKSIKAWRSNKLLLPSHMPSVFALQAGDTFAFSRPRSQ